MSGDASKLRGRGAVGNPANRFERLVYERDPDWDPEQDPSPATHFYRDDSRTIISRNDSPDIGFETSINPYRGCEHGCAYCYARPTHEFLGFSAGLDFESKILIKENAATLLRKELGSPKWKPQTLALCGVTDPYQPIERKLRLTRGCLEVLVEYRNPVCIVTKNHLVTRDIDLLKPLAEVQAVVVHISITSLKPDFARRLEPRTSSPRQRLAAVEALSKAGIPVGVLMAPIIPALNEPEIPSVLKAAANAGARWAGKEMLRLPLAVAPIFEAWLDRNEPGQKAKVLERIRAIRDGKLNDPRFGSRMRGEGIFADQISQMFHVACRRAGLSEDWPVVSAASFRRPQDPQMELGL